MYVAGNAAATAGNVVANAGLLRMGVVADLLDGAFFVFTALALYMLLKDVHKSAARAMLVFVALAAAITCVSAVFEFEGSCGSQSTSVNLIPASLYTLRSDQHVIVMTPTGL